MLNVLLNLIGLIVFIALVWFVLAVVKGTLGLILTILLFALAVVVVWRLVKSGFYSARGR